MSDDLEDLASLLGVPPPALAELLPPPIRDLGYLGTERRDYDRLPEGFWLRCGDPVLVLLGVTDDGVVVGEPHVRWEVQTPVLEVAATETFDDASSDVDLVVWLAARIAAAVERRHATFHVCERCRDSNPPEWMLGEALCQSCAEKDGVVF